MHSMISGIKWFLVRLLLSILFFGTPLLGFWLVSSLAAYLGGPSWMAWTAGALLFPIIPGFWEFYVWSHRQAKSKTLLTPLDRLSLRTFAVGLVALAVLLSFYPQTAFVALSTRGDWMLDGVKDSRADRVRQALFAAAGGVEWLYNASKSNPYKSLIDPNARQLAEEATKQREQDSADKINPEADQRESLLFHPVPIAGTKKDQETDEHRQSLLFHPVPIAHKDSTKTSQGEGDAAERQEHEADEQNKPESIWPWKQPTLHPAVAAMPASVETSFKSVAQYIAKQEKDPVLRIKALHDYVADRVAYDSDSFYAGKYPPQDAQTVFRTRKSVCAGYANLLSAMASAIKEKIVVVVGDARDPSAGDRLSGSGHAWNAASIKGRWYLIDACWDAGFVSREKGFTKNYRTDYLLIPPDVMIEDHFPDESTWQLLARPLSQGEFLRQPMLCPSFQSAELTLLTPGRARNEAESKAVAIVKNPKNQWLMATLEANGKKIGPDSICTNIETARLELPLPDKGTYRLNMFVNEKSQYGSYSFVGSVDFVSR